VRKEEKFKGNPRFGEIFWFADYNFFMKSNFLIMLEEK